MYYNVQICTIIRASLGIGKDVQLLHILLQNPIFTYLNSVSVFR